MTQVLMTLGESAQALNVSARSLMVTVPCNGLDSQETAQHHVQLAVLFTELKHFTSAIKHLLVARYIIELCGGARNPEIANVYIQLAHVCVELQEYPAAIRCMLEAKQCPKDLTKTCSYAESLANVYIENNNLDEALGELRMSYRLYCELCGEDDPRTKECKERMDGIRRKVYERNVIDAKEKMAAKAAEANRGKISDKDLKSAKAEPTTANDKVAIGNDGGAPRKSKSSKGKKK